MAHEFEQGFSVRQPTWHGLGTILPEYPGREEGMKVAGHDFQVVERPVYVGTQVDGGENDGGYEPTATPKFKALVKSSDDTVFNIVNESYGVVQPGILWDIADAMVDEENVKYETAGVLRNGAVLWVLARLDEPSFVPGDDSPIFPYISVSTTNDGTGSCKASGTDVRIVCMNTYKSSEAVSKKAGTEFTFRHTKNVMARIEDAKLALKGVRAGHAEFMALAVELAGISITDNQREMFVSSLIPTPPEALISDRVIANIDKARKQINGIFDSATVPEAHRNTAYGCWQAGIEYLDHLRPYRSKDTYFGRSMLTQEAAKTKLAGLVRAVANDKEAVAA